MKRLLAAAAVLTLGLAGAASGGHVRAAGTVSSSRLVKGGTIRITATIRAPAQVGHALRVTYRVTNVSKVPRKVKLAFGLWYVVRAQDLTTYDTRTLLSGAYLPYVPPTTLRPGQTVTSSGVVVLVRWAGPLRITPGWQNEALPTVRVGVKPSEPPRPGSAVREVLAATGNLLDHCAPTTPGVAVIGRIDAPKHSAPALRSRCSISLHHEHGFARAQVLVVSPPSLRGEHVKSPYEQLPYPKPRQNATAVAWLFVVTRDGAISLDSTSVDSTKNRKKEAPQWQWTTSGFQPQPGGSKCGGYGGGGGGYVGPYVEFVSKCR